MHLGPRTVLRRQSEVISRRLASFIAHRPRALVAILLAVAAAALFICITRTNLDTEVLDLLPRNFESVAGLKEFNSDFSQARTLVFAFVAEPGHADDLEPFRQHFMAELKKQPWIVRTMDSLPMESESGINEIQQLLPVLLLNLPPDQFKAAIDELKPDVLNQRLAKIRDRLNNAFDWAEQFQAQVDPVGLFARAIKPLISGAAMDEGSSFTSSDGLLQVAFAVTNQSGLGPKECQAIMDQVRALESKVQGDWTGYKPQILVTGRTAYVADISRSMDHDGLLSLVLSILIASGLFYLAFRRLVPLLGIVLVLLLSALVALALGMLILHDLNVVAVGFCSILVGIGVDFSFLLFGRYLQARRAGADYAEAVYVSVRDIGAAIVYVVITTSIGFFALNFSQSSGFAQLGTLVGLGVALAGLFSVLFLFLFFRPVKPVGKTDLMLLASEGFVRLVFRYPARILGVSFAVLATMGVIALNPRIPLDFDTNPTSLEPKTSPAAIARWTIASKLNQESDPVTILVKGSNAQEFHDQLERLTAGLEQSQADGKLKYVSSPVALTLSPKWIDANRAYLRSIDFTAVRTDVQKSLESAGFDLSAFQGLLDELKTLDKQKNAQGVPDLKDFLPLSSSWWILVDRYFAIRPFEAAVFVRPTRPLENQADQRSLQALVHQLDPNALVTGWKFTLFDLIPWAQSELVGFTVSVATLILILLWIVFRRLSLWLVHSSALAFSMLGLVACLKLLHLPVNLLNGLAFPVVLAIGVDHGIQFLTVSRREGDLKENLANVLKPLLICGLTAIAGFAVLIPAENPALSGIGMICSIGVSWCFLTTFFYIVPAFAFLHRRELGEAKQAKAAPAETVRL